MTKYFFDKRYLIKLPKSKRTYDLTKVKDRHFYYKEKLGDKALQKIKDIFETQSLIVYMLAPKVAGKGTYLSLLRELVGKDKFYQLSVGDLMREFVKTYNDRKAYYDDILSRYYRGFIPLKEAIESALSADVTRLVPTEFVLALIKAKINEVNAKIIFLDGFPRTEDQIMYSLVMRDLMAFRDDLDLFWLINVPLSVIDARLKYRRVCPKCGASRNIRLLPTEKIEWDKEKNEPVLICDNPECNGQKMVAKPGDEVGVAALMERMERDFKLMNLARKLHGVPRIEVFNGVPKDIAYEYFQDYEITPEYHYEYKDGQVKITTTPWQVTEDGVTYVSLLAAPVLVQFVLHLIKLLD